MLEAFTEEERRQDDVHSQKLAWQTAHIMSASGNYGKKGVKATELYVPIAEQQKVENTTQEIVKKFDSKESKQDYLENLMKTFQKGE